MRPRGMLNWITSFLLVGVLLSGFSVVLAKPALGCSVAAPNCKMVLFLSCSVEEKIEEHTKGHGVLTGIMLPFQQASRLIVLRTTPLVDTGSAGSSHLGRQRFIAWRTLRL